MQYWRWLWRCVLALALPILSSAEPNVVAKPTSLMVCPPPSSLVRDPKTLLWTSQQPGWKSYAPSFSKQANTFLGAQWQGIHVGNIFCLYQGDAMTFTISLQYATLTQEPSGNHWEPNQQGIRNCHAASPADCPFQPIVKRTSPDVNQLLDQLPIKTPETLTP